jgi:hypothetical protein
LKHEKSHAEAETELATAGEELAQLCEEIKISQRMLRDPSERPRKLKR